MPTFIKEPTSIRDLRVLFHTINFIQLSIIIRIPIPMSVYLVSFSRHRLKTIIARQSILETHIRILELEKASTNFYSYNKIIFEFPKT